MAANAAAGVTGMQFAPRARAQDRHGGARVVPQPAAGGSRLALGAAALGGGAAQHQQQRESSWTQSRNERIAAGIPPELGWICYGFAAGACTDHACKRSHWCEAPGCGAWHQDKQCCPKHNIHGSLVEQLRAATSAAGRGGRGGGGRGGGGRGNGRGRSRY
jgi:hypothetical protein